METQDYGYEYERIDLNPGFEIKPDMYVDLSEQFLYVMSTEKVKMVPLLK